MAGLFARAAQALARIVPVFDPDVLTSEQSAATIAGIRSIISGHPEEGLNPLRLAAMMKAAEAGDIIPVLDLAESMEEKYLHYRSVLSTRKLAVSSLPVTVTAASTDPLDERAADITREVMESACVRATLFDVLDAVGKGFSVSEIIWDQQATEWRPDRILWRRPQWFVPDQIDGTTLLLRGGPGDGVNSLKADAAEFTRGNFGTPLPYGKYVTLIHKSKSGVPIRGALSRAAAWAYLFQNLTVKSWAVFLEVYGHPLRIGKYGTSASREEKATLLRAVRSIAMDAAAIIPDSMSIEFESAMAIGGGTLHQDNLDWWNNQVSKVVLGQTGTSDTAAYQGTANAHEHVRQDIGDDDAAQLGAVLQRDIAAPVTMFNVGPGAKVPTITVGEPESEDVTALVANVKTFVALGGQVDAAWLGGKIGVPNPEPGAVLLAAPAPPAPFGGGDSQEEDDQDMPAIGMPGVAVAAQLPRAAVPVNDALAVFQAEQLKDWKPLTAPLIDPVTDLLATCSSLEEFQAGLAGLLKHQNPEELAETLARSTFAARLVGLTGAPIATGKP